MVKRFIPLISLLIALLASGAVLAKPDLIVTDIALHPENPIAGETVTITATVANVGDHDVDKVFYVRFAVNGVQIDAPTIPSGLKPTHTKAVSASWVAAVGTHTITVDVDHPFNRIDESDEGNNTLVATLVVPIRGALAAHIADLKVSVARFEDQSGSGFINFGEGVADALIERWVESGVRVLERSKLEAVMQERGLNPFLTQDLTIAGQNLGADLLIVGSVNKVNIQRVSLHLGLFRVDSASVEMGISARLVNAYTGEIEKGVSAEGKEEGATGFSVGPGKITSLLPPALTSICTGGLRADKDFYSIGEIVSIGYRNPGTAAWYTVEIDTFGGVFIKWLDWQYVPSGGCARWVWDQRDMWNTQMSPGMYIAKLWDGTSYIATVRFQIKLGSGLILPLVDEITVGSHQFAATIVGKATDSTLNRLVTELIRGIEEVAPQITATKGTLYVEAPASKPREGQIATILPDGRVVINLGASSGVSKGDFFQVLDTRNLITDPATGKILAYDILGVKGEIVVVEVRDQIAYSVKTSDFVPLVGDLVRLSTP